MPIRIKVERLGPRNITASIAAKMRDAVIAATDELAANIKAQGDANITGAGAFGSRWTSAFHVDVTRAQPNSMNANIDIGFDLGAIPYANIHEYGGTIYGKPMLWIPLSFATDAQGLYARDFPDPLFRVDRTGGKAPLLLSTVDKKPKYFGIEQVTLRPKFGIREMAAQQAATFASLYYANMSTRQAA